jgi:hypothetical protein
MRLLAIEYRGAAITQAARERQNGTAARRRPPRSMFAFSRFVRGNFALATMRRLSYERRWRRLRWKNPQARPAFSTACGIGIWVFGDMIHIA